MKKIILLILVYFFALAPWVHAQNFWNVLDVPSGFYGRSSATNSSGYFFVGTNDGVYRSTENGHNLLKIGLQSGILALKIDSNDNVFAGSGPIYFSIDNGDNWIEIATPAYFNEIFVNDSLFLLGNWGEIYTSHDFGQNWVQTLVLDNTQVVNCIIKGENGILFAGITAYFGGGGVYRSMDNGDTWEYAGLNNEWITALAFNTNDVLYAASRSGISGAGGGIFKSQDMGITWEMLSGMMVSALVIDSNNVLYAGCDSDDWIGGVYRSVDNGQTWEYIISGMGAYPSVEGLCLSPDGYLYIYDTKLYRSADPIYTSVDDNKAISKTSTISLYPNPVADKLSGKLIRQGNCEGTYKLSIISMGNQVAMEEEVSVVSGLFTIPVTSLPAGLYVLKLNNNKNIFQARFVKL